MLCVSVVIPAYNAARCLARALDSVLAQSEPQFEVLVVDDASTDATAALVQDFAARDRRVRLLRAPRNGGPGLARNQGIAASCGEWIALLDADDAFLPQRLERLAGLGDAHQADMVADNLLLTAPDPASDGEPPPGRPMFAAAQLPRLMSLGPRAFVEGNLLRPGAGGRIGFGYLKPLLRRSFLVRHGLAYDAARFSEDYLFYLRCLLHGASWIVTPEPLYAYTVDARSLTARHSADDLRWLATAEAGLLRTGAAAGDPRLRRSMVRHVRAVQRAHAWFGFATAIKDRDAVAAMSSLGRDPRNLVHVGREAIRALPQLLTRRRGAAVR